MNVLFRLSAAAMLLLCCEDTLRADEPYCVDSLPDLGCPGDKAKFERYLTDELDFCFRVELSCEQSVVGGMDLQLASNGGVGAPFGFLFGVPALEPMGCGAADFANVGNERSVKTCKFLNGRSVELVVTRVDMKACRDESADGCAP